MIEDFFGDEMPFFCRYCLNSFELKFENHYLKSRFYDVDKFRKIRFSAAKKKKIEGNDEIFEKINFKFYFDENFCVYYFINM